MSAQPDLLVVGGGIVGLSLAVHAARRGLHTTLVEAGELGGASTQRSGALLRAHYEDEGSARLARLGIEHFTEFEARYGGGAGFRETGFAFVPEPSEVESGALTARVEMLRGIGVETELLDAAALARIDPALAVDDVGVVAYEPHAGHAEPAVATATLAAAARAAGAELRGETAVAALVQDGGGAVVGARLRAGEKVVAARTVLCAGAWSADLAAGIGLSLPIRPTAVKLAFFARAVPIHLTVIDAPGGIYFRPLGDDATLVGRRTWTDEPLSGADAALPEVDRDFVAEAAERLARRLPAARGARLVGGRAGMLDMTPDGLPLVGPSDLDGLWLCCGWSGTGFKTGPAVGERLAAWLDGEPAPPELRGFAPDRELATAAGVRSPH